MCVFLDPPIITAPGLLCTEGCCQLPIMTVYSNANDVYQVCNTSFNPPDTTNILWYDDGTPAKGVNDEQVCYVCHEGISVKCSFT